MTDDARADSRTALLVALAAVLAYATALAGTFVYDDIHSVASNPGVHTLANLGRFFVDPTLFSAIGNVMYRPVLLCTFALDHALGGGDPLSFKLTNVALHAAVAWLLYGLLRAHGGSRRACGIAAALFAVHPLASEAVNMVSARSEVLCVFGLLLGLRGHLAWCRGDRRGAIAVTIGALVACGSKETGVLLLPLVCAQQWLVAGLPRGRAFAAALLRVLPALVVVVVYLAVRKALLGQATTQLLGRAGGDPLYGHTRDLATQLATMAAALPRVLVQMVWPHGQSLDPQIVYQRSPFAWPVLVGGGGLLLLTAIGLRSARTQPLRAFGLVFAWGTALPWIVIPLNLPLAEHRYYGPLCGLAAVTAALLAHTRAPSWLPTFAVRRVLPALPLATFALLAAWHSLDYRDERLLWQRALAHNAQSFRAHWGLGAAHVLRGDVAAAEPELARAVAIYPGFRSARRTWVECMLQLPAADGWPFRALVAAEELARQKDDDPYYRMLHANALLQCGIASGDQVLVAAAEGRALACLQIAPPKALVWRFAAQCRTQLGDHRGALQHYDTAIERGFDLPSLRVERAETLRALGRADEADRELRAAFARAPMDAAVRSAMDHRYATPPR